MRGISETVSAVFLIAIAVIIGVSLYFWAAGQSIQPPQEEPEKVQIDVSILNTTTGNISITNVDTKTLDATTLYVAENESLSCSVPQLEPGESTTCALGNVSGQITIYGENVEYVTVVFP
ncbi:MAG: hypothetical protein J7K68_01995 [Candidatus Diapherotrites archaeon]|nr:hypothetical protein [Candidatus Diapherotrites archaeon]